MLKALVRIVDDEADVRDSVSLFLQMAGLEVAAYAGAREFLARDDFARPGCVVLDVRMPDMTGIELQAQFLERGIDLPIIFLSAHGDIEMAVKAVQKGAVDFLVKPPQPEKLLELVQKTLAEHQEKRRADRDREQMLALYSELTPAEKKVMFLVAKGFPNTVIGEILGIAERTAKSHRARIYGKLDLENAVEASEFLRQAGLIEGGN